MLPPPNPKNKITVIALYEGCMVIHYATLQAKQFIEKEAPKYGRLFVNDEGYSFNVYVNRCFDFNEVIKYFRSYNRS